MLVSKFGGSLDFAFIWCPCKIVLFVFEPFVLFGKLSIIIDLVEPLFVLVFRLFQCTGSILVANWVTEDGKLTFYLDDIDINETVSEIVHSVCTKQTYHNILELLQVPKVGVSFPWEVKPVKDIKKKLSVRFKLIPLGTRIPVNVVLRIFCV